MYDLTEYKKRMEEDVLEGMREFAEEMDEEDEEGMDLFQGIARCKIFLEEFIDQLENVDGEEQALACVKDLVKKLNKLNNEYDTMLIETEERENLCEYVFGALGEIGIEVQEDVTEEWREW